MNILIPDSWLRVFLITKATPEQIKEYLSLSGPSVERINYVGKEAVYDIEITTNRVDAFSVYGVAREAAAILPEFGIPARLQLLEIPELKLPAKSLDIKIDNREKLCRRVLAVKLTDVKLVPSPDWLVKRLGLVGQRSINNIVDITNYLMWETGHPMHAFDYDRLRSKKIVIRTAKREETFTTLDNKSYSTTGGEIIFDDGNGEIIDLPGIMGTANTVIHADTKNVLLFIENSDPVKIRHASMTHAIRSQAAVINEKNPDPKLALTTLIRGVNLAIKIAGATIVSSITDVYPEKPVLRPLVIGESKLSAFLGVTLPVRRVERILKNLGFECEYKNKIFKVTPPSWRSTDINIEEDVIEEVARIYGYHNIQSTLPNSAPPEAVADPRLTLEEELKERLRDWGYTETYTYSMISKDLIDTFGIDNNKVYEISNPLSDEWVYMRPSLIPSLLTCVEQNLHFKSDLKLFELAMIYEYQKDNLPREKSTLVAVRTGQTLAELKGVAEVIFMLCGLTMPEEESGAMYDWYRQDLQLKLGKYGSLGMVNRELLLRLGINDDVAILDLDLEQLISDRKQTAVYKPIPKYPPSYEDLAFILPEGTKIGPVIAKLKNADKLISEATLLDSYKDTKTVHIAYQSTEKSLTAEDTRPVREKLIKLAEDKFGAKLKSA